MFVDNPELTQLILAIDEYQQLTDYATITRYPGNYESIGFAEARRAVTIARRVRRQARKLLPKAALKPIK